jgi:hypothetical protein
LSGSIPKAPGSAGGYLPVDLDGPLQVDGVHRTLRSSHPVKRTSTDALLIATGAAALAFATSAEAGAPFSCVAEANPQ